MRGQQAQDLTGGPRYKHDCGVWPAEDACRWVGRLREYDLYVHPREDHIESIARFGDDGPEYLSGPSSVRLVIEFVSQTLFRSARYGS